MRDLVIDASVLVKLFFEEEFSEAAARLVQRADRILAPDLIWAESVNVVWKRLRRQEIDQQAAACIASEMTQVPIQAYPSADLVLDALTVAIRYEQTVYDALYVALAVKTGLQLLTGDRRLVNSLRSSSLGDYVCWLGDANS